MKRFRCQLLILFFWLCGLSSSFSQIASQPQLTDLFTKSEFQRAGLSKLTPEELRALNAAFFRIMVVIGQSEEPGIGTGSGSEFFDSTGTAVAYVADDLTIYLWTGKPVAYLSEDSVYGFNGKHLGWLQKGAIFDNEGNVVAAAAARFQGGLKPAGPKGFKEFKPFKNFKEFKPFKPFFGVTWSDVPARYFFLQGAE